MARIPEDYTERPYGKRGVVRNPLPSPHKFVYVRRLVEKRFFKPLRFLCKDVVRIPKEQFGGIAGRRRCIYGAAEPIAHELGEPSGMVNVGVGYNNRRDFIGPVRERFPIMLLAKAAALVQAAVNQDFCLAGLKQVVRARYHAGAAVECKFHARAEKLFIEYNTRTQSQKARRFLLLFQGGPEAFLESGKPRVEPCDRRLRFILRHAKPNQRILKFDVRLHELQRLRARRKA